MPTNDAHVAASPGNCTEIAAPACAASVTASTSRPCLSRISRLPNCNMVRYTPGRRGTRRTAPFIVRPDARVN